MKTPLVVLLAALTLGGGAAAAQPGPDGPGSGRPGRRMQEALKLTDQQQKDIAKLRGEFQKKMIDLRSRVQSLRVDLRMAAGAEPPDRAAMEKTLQKITDLELQQKLARVDHLFAVRALLSPEQQKIWRGELRQLGGEARERMGAHRGWGHRPPEDAGPEVRE